MGVTMKVQFFYSAAEFRSWLTENGASQAELWVGFYQKTSGKPSITYPEAVDEALCHGWIDGIRKKVAVDAYTVRFTPRRRASQWSAVNIRRAKQLRDDGRMGASGLKAFKGADTQPRKYSYEQREKAAFDRESENRFRANRRAWDYFQAQPPWYRRTSTFWVTSAKQPETRERRLATLISDSELGQPIKPLRRPTVPKRKGKKQ